MKNTKDNQTSKTDIMDNSQKPHRPHLNPSESTLESIIIEKPSLEPSVEKRRLEMPQKCHSCYMDAMQGKSRKKAIKSFCEMCMGWDLKEVKACTSYDCPLYPYLPRTK